MKKPSVLNQLSAAERRILQRLSSPIKVQQFLDSGKYNISNQYYSPRTVLRSRTAHCFDGAVFAALALMCHGRPPLIVDLRAENDDDHVIAVFKERGYWGAIAQSNYSTLRFREPIYRTVRELVLSYFEFYFNLNREKTLRSYSLPVNLLRFRGCRWIVEDNEMELIADELDQRRHFPLVPSRLTKSLNLVDKRSFAAGTVGLDPRGAFQT